MADDTEATVDLYDFITKRNYETIGNSLTPSLIETVTQERQTQTVVHRILRRSAPEISFGVTETRTGSMTLLFRDQLQDYVGFLSGPTVFTLRCYSDHKLDYMHFIITGPIRVELDESTRRFRHVSFDYTEVL